MCKSYQEITIDKFFQMCDYDNGIPYSYLKVQVTFFATYYCNYVNYSSDTINLEGF